jgi:hypothetical protein
MKLMWPVFPNILAVTDSDKVLISECLCLYQMWKVILVERKCGEATSLRIHSGSFKSSASDTRKMMFVESVVPRDVDDDSHQAC